MELANYAAVTFLALFPIVNPLGAIPLFFTLTHGESHHELHRIELRITLYVVGILLFFMLLGPFVLRLFGISLGVLKIAGGLIVANTAWFMATGASRITADERAEATTKEDISFSPMAMPMLSGPGSIGVVMGISAGAHNVEHYLGLALGIIAIGLTVFLLLRSSEPLAGRLGPNSVGAINRIFGFLILAIGVQLIWNGVVDLRGAPQMRLSSRRCGSCRIPRAGRGSAGALEALRAR